MNHKAAAYLLALNQPNTPLARLVLMSDPPTGVTRVLAMRRCTELVNQGVTKSSAFEITALEMSPGAGTIKAWWYEDLPDPAPPRRRGPHFTFSNNRVFQTPF